jgi:hypothetical protein
MQQSVLDIVSGGVGHLVAAHTKRQRDIDTADASRKKREEDAEQERMWDFIHRLKDGDRAANAVASRNALYELNTILTGQHKSIAPKDAFRKFSTPDAIAAMLCCCIRKDLTTGDAIYDPELKTAADECRASRHGTHRGFELDNIAAVEPVVGAKLVECQEEWWDHRNPTESWLHINAAIKQYMASKYVGRPFSVDIPRPKNIEHTHAVLAAELRKHAWAFNVEFRYYPGQYDTHDMTGVVECVRLPSLMLHFTKK